MTIGREKRGEVGTAQARDLPLVGAVGVHHPDLHPVGTHQTLTQKPLIRREAVTRGMPCAIHDLPAVRREESTAVVTWRVRQTADVSAVDGHGVELEIAILERSEDESLSIRR